MSETSKSFKMPFGKYKDQSLDEIPVDYLIWLRSQSWLKDNVGIPLDLFLDGDLLSRVEKMKSIVTEALIARGMSDGESNVFLTKLLYLLRTQEGE